MMDACLSRGTRALLRLTALAAALALAACASPASRFYTLGAGSGPAGGDAPGAARTAGAKPAFLFELAPVDVPSQVARNQLVVEAGGSRVDVLEQERWASLPGDEIRRALSGDLAARLGTFDVYGAPYPAGVPVYRVTANVRRFESWPGERAVLDAVWSVRAVSSQSVLTCRTLADVPVGAGYAALVEGHRRAVAQMADQIAAVLRAQRGPSQPVPPADIDCTVGRPTPVK
ncbi:PqiC family protein [Trinickia caryophylli]|uniref:ABC-type transport auxiliary lipoprotein component domain-containing protein n=1 Tax=Trinickia caryophylli TaxID=28094 RepID=A0A1X7CC09_TRICW|nr:PqiC family protein [Trinickia caryophylli]PMS12484.1 hypothetical protein C0Z17_08830 [Trinickia caryophylli]TRX19686.1 membrane integrity-associated transporter subunit PqiC [Trinickia caryophylli]WQE13000.1 PqiC family protein [Trinickia caryophylli]SME93801.1 hypothetical protein SAMN06295900_101148 [Trinickia caryophylli]GLU30732.1 hypothetical protein Busp01_05740 [Trinickia caryophylli]